MNILEAPNVKKLISTSIGDGINRKLELDTILPKSEKEGFNNFNTIPDNIGMRFYFPSRDASITMIDMKEDLYLIAIDEYKIKDIVLAKAGDELIELEGRYIIEVSSNNPIIDKIKVGDIVKFRDFSNTENNMKKKYKFKDEFGQEIKANTHTFLQFRDTKATPRDFGVTTKVKKKKKKKFSNGGKGYLLDHESHAQMVLVGDERIFSRLHTKELTDLINKKPTKDNIIKLGKLLVDIVNIHNTQKQEYVKE